MSDATSPVPVREPATGSMTGAVAVVLSASLAMTATLPGRTFGVSLITTRLLADFEGLTQNRFALINLVAALVGGACCLPAGWLLDRLGARRVLAVVLLGLAGSVFAMSRAQDVTQLAVTLTLTRALGQSMLSVLSLAMLGKWFRDRPGPAMGVYAVLMTMFLAVCIGVLGPRVTEVGWRAAWAEVAWVLLAVTPVICLTALRPRHHAASTMRGPQSPPRVHGVSLGDALRSRCFWAFALCAALFNLVSAGVTLFLQLILEARGLSEQVYQTALIVSLFTGLLANLVGGWLTTRWSMARLLAVTMLLLAGALAGLAVLDQAWQAYLQAGVFGLAGGGVTVLFFSVWVHAFGPARLGRIQGAAQVLCVIGSAAGPVAIAQGRHLAGGYLPVLVTLAVVAACLGILALRTPVPNASTR